MDCTASDVQTTWGRCTMYDGDKMWTYTAPPLNAPPLTPLVHICVTGHPRHHAQQEAGQWAA